MTVIYKMTGEMFIFELQRFEGGKKVFCTLHGRAEIASSEMFSQALTLRLGAVGIFNPSHSGQ